MRRRPAETLLLDQRTLSVHRSSFDPTLSVQQAPVEKLEQEAVKLQSVVGVLKAAASEAVPVVPTQVLATVVTKNCRGGVGRDPAAWARPTIWDYDRVKKDSNTGNWVRLSASSDVIRLFSVSECAVALNLPPNFVSCGASETDQRGLLGRAFGPCSIAHLLKLSLIHI